MADDQAALVDNLMVDTFVWVPKSTENGCVKQIGFV
jgi:hypothetical protein